MLDEWVVRFSYVFFDSFIDWIFWRQQKKRLHKSPKSLRAGNYLLQMQGLKGWRKKSERSEKIGANFAVSYRALSRQRSESSYIEQKAAKHKSKGWVQHRLVESAFCLVSPSSESCALLCFFARVLSGVNSLKEAKLEPISSVEVPRFSCNIFSSSSPQAHNCGCT